MSTIDGQNQVLYVREPLTVAPDTLPGAAAQSPPAPHLSLEPTFLIPEAEASADAAPTADPEGWGSAAWRPRPRRIRRRVAGWLLLSVALHVLALASAATLAPHLPPRVTDDPLELAADRAAHDFGEGFGRQEGFVYFRVPTLHGGVDRPAVEHLRDVDVSQFSKQATATLPRPAAQEVATAHDLPRAPDLTSVPPRRTSRDPVAAAVNSTTAEWSPPPRRVRPAAAVAEGVAVGRVHVLGIVGGGGLELPKALDNPQPVYPPESLAAGVTGRVTLRVTIASEGDVREAVVYASSGVEELDQAALAVIGQWRFEPRHYGGDVYEILVPIRFTLDP